MLATWWSGSGSTDSRAATDSRQRSAVHSAAANAPAHASVQAWEDGHKDGHLAIDKSFRGYHQCTRGLHLQVTLSNFLRLGAKAPGLLVVLLQGLWQTRDRNVRTPEVKRSACGRRHVEDHQEIYCRRRSAVVRKVSDTS